MTERDDAVGITDRPVAKVDAVRESRLST